MELTVITVLVPQADRDRQLTGWKTAFGFNGVTV